ncbi:hypothetical protein GFV12_05250 [Desulfurobacterium thermolithotrophum]|uniref:hypothetical protein n=1 Tax=Desulfurobacterium thermolithotrophum TaxID=64160 RepID=UPI0013D8720A|nr:hypothetical protein [Desulfurobacterium thermolithotrophum]
MKENRFYITFGLTGGKISKKNLNQVIVPEYISFIKKDWFRDFEDKIKRFLEEKEVFPIISCINVNGNSVISDGYHRLNAYKKLEDSNKYKLKPPFDKEVRKYFLHSWLRFCLEYAQKKPYRKHSQVISLLRKILKDNRKETLEHKKEKIKAVFWLIDSGIPSNLINLESPWGVHIPDVAVELPLKGTYSSIIYPTGDIYEKRLYFTLKFAIEIGNWSKNPNYLEWGIPFVWVPFREISEKDLFFFFKKQSKQYNCHVFFIKHYVHIVDETFSGFLFVPNAKKEQREVK